MSNPSTSDMLALVGQIREMARSIRGRGPFMEPNLVMLGPAYYALLVAWVLPSSRLDDAGDLRTFEGLRVIRVRRQGIWME